MVTWYLPKSELQIFDELNESSQCLKFLTLRINPKNQKC